MLIRAPMFWGNIIDNALSRLEYVTDTIKYQAISPQQSVASPHKGPMVSRLGISVSWRHHERLLTQMGSYRNLQRLQLLSSGTILNPLDLLSLAVVSGTSNTVLVARRCCCLGLSKPCHFYKTNLQGKVNGLTYLPPEQKGRYFANDNFRCIFVKVKFCILIKNFTHVCS